MFTTPLWKWAGVIISILQRRSWRRAKVKVKSVQYFWVPNSRHIEPDFSDYLALDSTLYLQRIASLDFTCSCENSAFLQIRLQGIKMSIQKLRSIQLMATSENFGLTDLPTITERLCGRDSIRIQLSGVTFSSLNQDIILLSSRNPLPHSLHPFHFLNKYCRLLQTTSFNTQS